MSLFGKEYDKEINELIIAHNKLQKSLNESIIAINKLQEKFSILQESLIQIAKIQASHKEMITFLLKYATNDVDKSEDVQKDFFKMIKKLKETEQEVKEKST